MAAAAGRCRPERRPADPVRNWVGQPEQRQAAGFDQEALELSARQGLANGAFEESDEEAGAVAEAFFPATSGEGDTVAAESVSAIATVPDSLAEKLAVKAHSLGLAERQA